MTTLSLAARGDASPVFAGSLQRPFLASGLLASALDWFAFNGALSSVDPEQALEYLARGLYGATSLQTGPGGLTIASYVRFALSLIANKLRAIARPRAVARASMCARDGGATD
jgi:hypothetical protein